MGASYPDATNSVEVDIPCQRPGCRGTVEVLAYLGRRNKLTGDVEAISDACSVCHCEPTTGEAADRLRQEIEDRKEAQCG